MKEGLSDEETRIIPYYGYGHDAWHTCCIGRRKGALYTDSNSQTQQSHIPYV